MLQSDLLSTLDPSPVNPQTKEIIFGNSNDENIMIKSTKKQNQREDKDDCQDEDKQEINDKLAVSSPLKQNQNSEYEIMGNICFVRRSNSQQISSKRNSEANIKQLTFEDKTSPEQIVTAPHINVEQLHRSFLHNTGNNVSMVQNSFEFDQRMNNKHKYSENIIKSGEKQENNESSHQNSIIQDVNSPRYEQCQSVGQYKHPFSKKPSLKNKEIIQVSPGWDRIRKIKNVIIGILRFRMMEVQKINNQIELVENIHPQNQNDKYEAIKKGLQQKSIFSETINNFQNFLQLCSYAASGTEEQVQKMDNLIQNNHQLHIRSTNDPDYLLNLRNYQGETLLYIACVNGNLNVRTLNLSSLISKNSIMYFQVVKLLFFYQADPLREAKLKQKLFESPMGAAIRWGHNTIIEYMLRNHKYPSELINRYYSESKSKQQKILFKKYLPDKKKKGFLCC